jgi:hypothetical protein
METFKRLSVEGLKRAFLVLVLAFVLVLDSFAGPTKIREGTQTEGALPAAQGGVPSGGSTNNILGKSSGTDYDYGWKTISAILDSIGSTRGQILYRGSGGWSVLSPGTDGNQLTTHGAGADPTWAAAGGGGGGSIATTNNLLKGDGSGNAVDSTMSVDGTAIFISVVLDDQYVFDIVNGATGTSAAAGYEFSDGAGGAGYFESVSTDVAGGSSFYEPFDVRLKSAHRLALVGSNIVLSADGGTTEVAQFNVDGLLVSGNVDVTGEFTVNGVPIGGGGSIASTTNLLKGDGAGNAVAALTATGGANHVLKQTSVGGAITSGAVTDAELSTSDVTTNDASASKHGFEAKGTGNAYDFRNGNNGWSIPSIAPINAQNGNYTFVLSDAGKTIVHTSASAGHTYTIPANASVAYPTGTMITIINANGSASITLAITSDTLRRGDGTSGTGSRTIAADSVVTIIKTGSTEWYITGKFS